jgi:hypothetical protein
MMTKKGRYTNAMAQHVLDRLANGEPLVRICRDDETPSLATIYNWVHTRPAFRHAYRLARAAASEGLAAETVDNAREVTPKNASAKRVLLNELHWQTARLQPKTADPNLDAENDGYEDLADRLDAALKRAEERRARRKRSGNTNAAD